MDSISGVSTSAQTLAALQPTVAPEPTERELLVEQTFQDFVAGTLYKQMLKALRRAHGKPAYFHGGQAEELFQSQLDQTIAERLARDHGQMFSKQLFTVFKQQIGGRSQNSPRPQVEPSEMVSALGGADRRK